MRLLVAILFDERNVMKMKVMRLRMAVVIDVEEMNEEKMKEAS